MTDVTTFHILQGETFPTVSKQLVKYLGKWYDSTCKGVKNTKMNNKEVRRFLDETEGLDPSNRQFKFKIWWYEYGRLHVQGSLLIYEI